jgi:predicted SAM-dependent methyltransferase
MATYLEIAAEKPRGLNWSVVNLADHDGVESQDLTDLPTTFLDEEFNGIYSEHFIEHLYKYQGINFFKEALRIMKPGGTIRTVWPAWETIEWLVSDEDLSKHEFVQFYFDKYIVKEGFAPKGNEHRPKQEQVALGLLHQKGQHLHIWGEEEMKITLEDLGFNNVRSCEYLHSTVPEFNGIDTPSKVRAWHSTVVEASKPW